MTPQPRVPGARTKPARPRVARGAFTLVEMLVVVAIILVVLGLTLPSLSQMWDQRKVAEAQNTIQGLLITTRANAMQADGIQSGIFFFVDAGGTQRIARIEQVDPSTPHWANVFAIEEGTLYSLPAPMRVVPRYAVTVEDSDNAPYAFGPAELVNNDFNLPASTNIGQRHRNFFTMVFNSRGELLVWRDVLVQDRDADGNLVGDVTGLSIRNASGDPEITEYWPADGAAPEKLARFPANAHVPGLITEADGPTKGTAINFPSVDGLLVYDDALFNEAGNAATKRNFLLESARPFYVNRLTGMVITGPAGEGQ